MTAIASHYVDTSPREEPSSGVHAKPLTRPPTIGMGLIVGRTSVRILDAVGERFGFTWEELLSKRRTAHLANARHVAAWLMRQSGMSYPEIGRAIGGRDHTTAMKSVARVEEQRAAAAGIQDALDELLQLTAPGHDTPQGNGTRVYDLDPGRSRTIELADERG